MDGDSGRIESVTGRPGSVSGVVQITLRGILGHPQGQRLLEALAEGLASGARMLILDVSRLDAIEPGVPGRVITRCVERRLIYSEAAVVTRSAGNVALARAAAVVFKHGKIHVVPTLADAEALAAASMAARGGERRGSMAVSGEHPRAGMAAGPNEGAPRRTAG